MIKLGWSIFEYMLQTIKMQKLKRVQLQIKGYHSPSSADSRKFVVKYKQKYVHEVLVNRLV